MLRYERFPSFTAALSLFTRLAVQAALAQFSFDSRPILVPLSPWAQAALRQTAPAARQQ